MSEPDLSCAEISLRLIGGEHASDDPALARHVGSCLRCFRTATEMRELPHIAALMREGQAPDPGEDFWMRFPAVVSAAWEQHRGGKNPLVLRWHQLTDWLRQPFAAALVGAGVAALVLTLLGRQGPVTATATPATLGDDDDLGEALAAPSATVDEEDAPWELLELTDVKTRLAQVDQDGASAGGLDDGDADSPAEEVELLDGDDLPVVAQAMRAPGRI